MDSKFVIKISFTILFIGILAIICMRVSDYSSCSDETCSSSDVSFDNETSTRTLSRSKRFLIFPDGSSLQLVFCVQTAAVIPIGDIFLYGNTAALAWNLPTDPNFLLMLKEYEKTAQKRMDATNIYYVDDKGKLLAKVPYKRRIIVNPAFSKRSINENFKEKLKIKIDRMKMHERQLNRDYLIKENFDLNSIEFHRNSRVDLYEKLEPFITALGGEGRQCILYKLCEAAKVSARQGTFLQEMLRVVFTLPKGRKFQKEEHNEYDTAHLVRDNCASIYPGCAEFDVPLQFDSSLK